ncbi:MAG: hypothetical protein ACWGG5_01585 [Stenotrophomonas sp.]
MDRVPRLDEPVRLARVEPAQRRGGAGQLLFQYLHPVLALAEIAPFPPQRAHPQQHDPGQQQTGHRDGQHRNPECNHHYRRTVQKTVHVLLPVTEAASMSALKYL